MPVIIGISITNHDSLQQEIPPLAVPLSHYVTAPLKQGSNSGAHKKNGEPIEVNPKS